MVERLSLNMFIKNGDAGAVALDISKMFDKVSHTRLLHRLRFSPDEYLA